MRLGTTFFLSLMSTAALASAAVAQPSTPYTALDEVGAPLRSAFNADSGKVRVLMLVAPT